jgi:hypothetical protein
MKVAVIDKRTGEVVARYPITLRGHSYMPADEAYFTDAWGTAAKRGIGSSESRKEYRLRFLAGDERHRPT